MTQHSPLRSLPIFRPLLTLLAVTLLMCSSATGQPFVHPGGVHTQEDLDRMRDRVAAGDSPWVQSWEALITERKAQLDYRPAPRENMGASRQRAAADAVAAYLLTIRGYVSGDHRYTDHAISILNQWSAAVNQRPSGSDQPGLNGIYTYEFAVVGEILRIYVGDRWAQEDFDRFKNMMREYLYPVCREFLDNHNGACISHYWANWDACDIAAIGAMGVLLDDREMFNEAVDYFKNGDGNGSIKNAVYFVHPGGLGQWQEAGRDMEHATLGVGLLATFCEIAWKQGLDLYGHDNNRLLAGAEYAARYQLWKPVPYKFYDNCADVNQYWVSRSQRGRLQRPIWEQIYNHYVVRMGLEAPHVTAITKLNRPEGFTHDDHLGYGTLTHTLKPSVYPPLPVPPKPEGLKATAGVGRVFLAWNPPEVANGFAVHRATNLDGPFEEIAQYRGVIPEYYDQKVENGTTYYYRVAARNQAGTSELSEPVQTTPAAAEAKLPDGWAMRDIGRVAAEGKTEYAPVGEGTFVASTAGFSLAGEAEGMVGEGSKRPRGQILAAKEDGISFTYKQVEGDTALTVRIIGGNLRGSGPLSRVGIAIRGSLEPDAAAAALMVGDAGYRVAHFGFRPAAGERMELVRGNAYSGLGQVSWYRLTRSGNTFTGYQSDDGKHWHRVKSAIVEMPVTSYVGLAVASGSENVISVTYDHVSVE